MATIPKVDCQPCQFNEAYRGKCGKPTTNGWCDEHENILCCSCKQKAVCSCDKDMGGLICGASLCATCKHSIHTNRHVTMDVASEEIAQRDDKEKAIEVSRTSPHRRLDKHTGIPVNLFELLKGDWKSEGYRLEPCYFLELKHGLMGFFPAKYSREDRMVFTTDKALLADVWKGLQPRDSKMGELVCCVHPEKLILFEWSDKQSEQERCEPHKLLTREIFERLVKDEEEPFRWAPGLLSFRDFSREKFLWIISQATS